MTTVVLLGVVVTSPDELTAQDLAASIYIIQNQGRPPEDCDTLPEGVTYEHIERVMARHRIQANRRAIEAYKAALSTPLPKTERTVTPAEERIANDQEYTGRVPVWVFVVLVLVIGLATWGGIDLVSIIGKGLRLW